VSSCEWAIKRERHLFSTSYIFGERREELPIYKVDNNINLVTLEATSTTFKIFRCNTTDCTNQLTFNFVNVLASRFLMESDLRLVLIGIFRVLLDAKSFAAIQQQFDISPEEVIQGIQKIAEILKPNTNQFIPNPTNPFMPNPTKPFMLNPTK
jgi:hypothetical protein